MYPDDADEPGLFVGSTFDDADADVDAPLIIERKNKFNVLMKPIIEIEKKNK